METQQSNEHSSLNRLSSPLLPSPSPLFDTLSADVLGHILSLVPDDAHMQMFEIDPCNRGLTPYQIYTFLLVCRRWQTVLKEYMIDLHVSFRANTWLPPTPADCLALWRRVGPITELTLPQPPKQKLSLFGPPKDEEPSVMDGVLDSLQEHVQAHPGSDLPLLRFLEYGYYDKANAFPCSETKGLAKKTLEFLQTSPSAHRLRKIQIHKLGGLFGGFMKSAPSDILAVMAEKCTGLEHLILLVGASDLTSAPAVFTGLKSLVVRDPEVLPRISAPALEAFAVDLGDECHSLDLSALPATAPRLQRLTLPGPLAPLDPLGQLPELRELSYTYLDGAEPCTPAHLAYLAQCCPGLVKLTLLRNMAAQPDRAAPLDMPVEYAFPQLQELRLPMCLGGSALALDLIRRAPQLTALEITPDWGLVPGPLATAAPRLTALELDPRFAALRNPPPTDAAEWDEAARALPLERVTLSTRHEYVTCPACYKSIFEHCAGTLREVELRVPHTLDDAGLRECLIPAPQLTSLKCFGTCEVTDAGLAHLAECFPHLRVLRITCKASAQGITRLVERLAGTLRELSVYDAEMTEDALQQMLAVCPMQIMRFNRCNCPVAADLPWLRRVDFAVLEN